MKILDVLTAPWAIHPDRMKEIIEIYSTQVRAGKMDINTIESKISLFGKKEDEQAYDVINGVAVLDIQGVLSKRASWFMMFFGYAGMQAIGENLKKALADPSVKAVLLNIDSPGGTVDGTAELAQLIYESRGEKPIVAFTDGMIASAAYWIASAADTRYISSDTTEVGSIGVIMTHVDYSQAYEKVGIKITQIVSGKYKNIGSPYKPLGDEAKDIIQSDIDYLKSVFVNDVAKNLGVPVDDVLKVMTTDTAPPVFLGRQAINAGLVDGMSTMDELLNRLADPESAAMIVSQYKSQAKTREGKGMDLKMLKEKHPEVYKAVFDEGAASVVIVDGDAKVAEGKAAGLIEGAEQELKRIQAIEALAMPGQEALIAEMKADGKTTGPEAAVKLIAADKTLREAKGKDIVKDSTEEGLAVPAAAAPSDEEGVEVDADAPLDERAKAIWDKKKEIRAEFGKFETFLAYLEADEKGLVKILGQKKK